MSTMNERSAGRAATLPLALSLAAVLALAAPGTGLLAGEDEAKSNEKSEAAEKKAAEKSESKPRVYTNKDLARYRREGGRRITIVDTTGSMAPDVAKPPSEVLYPDEKKRRLAEIEAEIAAAGARIAALELRGRSVANPYLPRPQISEEEREAEAGMDSRQIQEKIRAERAELEKRLADLRAEQARVSATPTRPRSQTTPADAPPSPQPGP
jgi:hypothetical protein